MSTSRIERLKSLPRRAGETWQGGLVRMPFWITGEGPKPFRPYLPMWVAARADKVHTGQPLRPEKRNFGAAVDALLAFALESEFGGYRPARIEVDDPALAEHLGGLLAETGIGVHTVERLDAVCRVLDSMARDGFGSRSPLPGLLAGTDVTLQRVRRFAEAAAAFYRAAPWQYLTDEDLIRIDEPKGPPGMRVAVVLGNARSTYGLAFYRAAAEYFKSRRSAEEGPMGSLPASGVCHVTFEPITDIPLDDADLWEEHGLAVAGNDAYPLPARFDSRGEIKRPGVAELAHLEAVLWAFSATSESEIDSGRWHKEVKTYDGSTAVTLAIPDLLKPPPPRELMRRGFAPDRRAHERLFAEMDRYFEEHPPGSVEEMNAVMQSRFTGKTIDEIGSTPGTPVEQAQDLCYQAFDAHGRRCVQLARQALAICPDCADAYVILAERAGTLEAELDFYTKGVAAGQRALGAEKFEKAVGHFWGITSTRPYMRARLGLATTLGALGRLEEAVEHLQELLRLNPDDNQGVRYLLLPRLLELGRDAEAARLLKASDEESAVWAYARALLAFRLSGKSATAQQEIRRAFQTNLYAAECLLASELPPLPDHYSPGSPEEGAICAAELRPAFAASSGAMEWLAFEHRRRQRAAAARQKAQRRRRKQGRKKRKDR